MAIAPVSFKAGVYIGRNAGNNKAHKYLYNEVMAVVEEYKIPAVVKTKGIDLPSVTENILEKLSKFGIEFKKLEK